MSVGMPSRFSYASDPFEVTVSTGKTVIPTTTWTSALGDTAILCVEVPADGQSVALCRTAFAGTVDDFPNVSLVKAFRDDTAGLRTVMVTASIALSDVPSYRLIASGSFDAKCWFLPVFDPGS